MDASRTTIVFGPPGCGKTTTLLNKVGDYFASEVIPEEIGFVSFTKQACEEAKGRAMTKFGLTKKRLVNFRTLHSMAFNMLGLKRASVINFKHYNEVAEACGISLSFRASRMNTEEGLWVGATRGDKILFLENLARISGITLDEALEASEFGDIDRLEVNLWSRTLKSYKDANALVDFTDMVQNWLAYGVMPRLKVLFVDEAQDLSKLQWDMVYKLADQDCDIWVAGDDDQAIFKWSGAHPEKFVNLKGTRVTLHQSYRVPKVVHALAMEMRTFISDSVEKVYAPTEEQGFLDYYSDLEQINMDSGKWLILCRNNYAITQIEETCRKLGYWYDSLFEPPERSTYPILNWHRFLKGEPMLVRKTYSPAREQEEMFKMLGEQIEVREPYDKESFLNEHSNKRQRTCTFIRDSAPWYDSFLAMGVALRTYYRSVLAKKEDIRGVPRIRLSTIHGSKGSEEDNVVLFTDMSRKTYLKASENWADEYRVYYVGVTRTKVALHIIRPQTNMCLPMLSI